MDSLKSLVVLDHLTYRRFDGNRRSRHDDGRSESPRNPSRQITPTNPREYRSLTVGQSFTSVILGYLKDTARRLIHSPPLCLVLLRKVMIDEGFSHVVEKASFGHIFVSITLLIFISTTNDKFPDRFYSFIHHLLHRDYYVPHFFILEATLFLLHKLSSTLSFHFVQNLQWWRDGIGRKSDSRIPPAPGIKIEQRRKSWW